MKKAIITFAALMLVLMPAAAVDFSGKAGVIGGLMSSKTNLKDIDQNSFNGINIGLAYHQPLVLGFALQPAIVYCAKGSSVDLSKFSTAASLNNKIGYVEIPVQVQWGMDLALLRAFVLAEPFIGYAVTNGTKLSVGSGTYSSDGKWDGINRFEYGCALGFGAEVIERIQVSAKYFWNFNDLNPSEGIQATAISAWNTIKGTVSDKQSFHGLTISAALFF